MFELSFLCAISTNTMLYLVGLGLSDETDITVKGLEVVKKASRVYLEAYTSILLVDQTVLVLHPVCSSVLCQASSRKGQKSQYYELTLTQ